MITDEHLLSHIQNLTIEHIKKGAVGYSEYFLEYPLKDRVICTDYSCRKIKYKDEKGELITDPEMTNLSDRLFKSIKERNRELTIQYMKEITDHLEGTSSEVTHFMELAQKFSQQDLEVFKMFSGEKNSFYHDVLRHICSKTVEK